MTKATGKARGRGRPTGSKNADKKISVKELWDSLSAAEKKRTFAKATANQRLAIAARVERDEREVESVNVRFIMSGVPATCPKCGAEIPFASENVPPSPGDPKPVAGPTHPPGKEPYKPGPVCPEIDADPPEPSEPTPLEAATAQVWDDYHDLIEENLRHAEDGLPPLSLGELVDDDDDPFSGPGVQNA